MSTVRRASSCAHERIAGLRCLCCGALYSPDHFVADCPVCRRTAPSNLVVEYRDAVLDGVTRDAVAAGPRSIWRYAHSLPVGRDASVSLGEGLTPLVALPRLARELGLGCLHAKCEFANPTGSFKDRLASVAVSAGRALFGARVIASSSSGNAGAAAAAYATRAGLPSIVFTFVGAAGPMMTQMQAYGAMVVAVEDKAHRWTLLDAGVRRFGWFPTSPFFGPVVGSNPYGIEGYKSLAYEVAEQLEWRVPDWVVLPVCYGDALVGMARGFAELLRLKWIERMPRLVAAEIYGSLSQAEREGRDDPPSIPRSYDTVAGSIGAAQSTYQALKFVRESHGAAVRVPDEVLLRWHRDLAGKEGLFVEPSSAAAVGAVDLLRQQGTIRASDTVVCLLTAGGLKDPAALKSVPPIPTVPPDLDRALGVLEEVYGVDAAQLSAPQAEGDVTMITATKRFIRAATAALIGLTALAQAPALAFPDRPITMIVPWAPGGSTDQTARVLAKAAEKQLGQPIVILNKPGASTMIGMRELAQAKPDGYTIGTLSSTTYLAPLTGQAASYEMLKDFAFISYYGDNLIGIAVLKDKPWKTLQDLVEDGKKNPDKLNYGTGGANSTQHLMVEALQRRTGAKFNHVPQRGSAGSIPALLGNHVDFISEVSVWAPHVESGQARLLVLNTPKRAAAYPNVPTYAELGFEYLRSVQAIIGPAGIPEDIRLKLEAAFRKALEDPGFKDTMAKLSMEIIDLPGPQVREVVAAEMEKAKRLISEVQAK